MLVLRDSSYANFDDLKGARFAFNDVNSLSGFHCMRFHLLERRRRQSNSADPFFAKAVSTGGHQRSLEALLLGLADCVAIDITVLRKLRQSRRWRARLAQLRSLSDVRHLGPYPGQPFVALRSVFSSSSSSSSGQVRIESDTNTNAEIQTQAKERTGGRGRTRTRKSLGMDGSPTSKSSGDSTALAATHLRQALLSATPAQLAPLGWRKLVPVCPGTYDGVRSLLRQCAELSADSDLLAERYESVEEQVADAAATTWADADADDISISTDSGGGTRRCPCTTQPELRSFSAQQKKQQKKQQQQRGSLGIYSTRVQRSRESGRYDTHSAKKQRLKC